MDVHGNDNGPEWGLCETPGCSEPAEPLWFSGGFPDDPDLLLCYRHTGEHIGKLRVAVEKALVFHNRYCDRVGAADGWARAVHEALRAALTAD